MLDSSQHHSSPIFSKRSQSLSLSPEMTLKEGQLSFIDPQRLKEMIAKKTALRRRVLDPCTIHARGGRKQPPLPQWSTYYNTKRQVNTQGSFFVHRRPENREISSIISTRPKPVQLINRNKSSGESGNTGRYEHLVSKTDVVVNEAACKIPKASINLSRDHWCSHISSKHGNYPHVED